MGTGGSLRWLGPVLCLLVAAGTFAGLHLSSDGPVWVFVGIDRLVGPDPVVQATWTWRAFALLGLVWAAGVWALGRREGRADAAADP